MVRTQLLKYVFLVIPLSVIIFIVCCYFCKTKIPQQPTDSSLVGDPEFGTINNNNNNNNNNEEEHLMCFQGGEDLTISDILDAPGEVIGKSTYGGTLYKASILSSSSTTTTTTTATRSKSNSNDDDILLLRFLRPACSGTTADVIPVVHSLGLVRHPNLVPLTAFYMGPRGEKLLVHPFYPHPHPNLSHFIQAGNNESHKWDVICSIALGLVKGLAYLHTGFHKPMIHGNLKSKNVLLGPDFQPYISDYSLYLLLNPTAGQEMLENSASEGYKAPELMKMKDVSESTDIYSLGILLLELLTGKEPVNVNSSDYVESYLPNVIRRAILDHRIKDMYHPNIVLDLSGRQRHRTEDCALKLVQLAMSCCSPSPSLRPQAREVMRKIEEISKEGTPQHQKT